MATKTVSFKEAFEYMLKTEKEATVCGARYRVRNYKLEFYQTVTDSWVVEWVNETLCNYTTKQWELQVDKTLSDKAVCYAGSTCSCTIGKYLFEQQDVTEAVMKLQEKLFDAEGTVISMQLLKDIFGDKII